MLSEYQKQQAKIISERAKKESEIRYENKEKNILHTEKIKYSEEVNKNLSKEFSQMLDEEIIRMGYNPIEKRKEWDKEVEAEFMKSKYKNI